MQKLQSLLFLALFGAFAFATEGEISGERVPVSSLAEAIQGNYKIDLVGGAKPRDHDDSADVSVEEGTLVLTLPYCPPGISTCDPGYIFLSAEKTEVYYLRLSADHETYTILMKDGEQTYRYRWDRNGNVITFQNFQYVLRPGVTVPLEHVLHKI